MASSLILLFLIAACVQIQSLPIYFPRAHRQDLLPSLAKEETRHYRHSKITTYTTHFFQQTLDHFNYRPESYMLFNQKYLLNTQFWDEGPHHSAPIFVYTGNEGDIGWFADNTGFLPDIAPRFRALLVFIEHRFYGDSLPFGNKSIAKAETLGYLSSEQALADFATLITSLKHNLSAEASPVVVFGGSYGGMLSAWFRLKYPHIAIGALASSAPILQFDNITPSSSFYYGVSKDFKDESLNCFDVIKGSWAELMAMENPKGLRKLSKEIKSCSPLDSVDSARNWLDSAFVYTAMVDYPTAANFMSSLPAYPVKEMCRIIDRSPPKASKLEKAIAAASLYYNYANTKKCFDLASNHDPHDLNLWGWQVCTEMVMPMSSSNDSNSMFPPFKYDYNEFQDRCFRSYKIRPRPHWITTEYGGHRIDQVLKRFGSNIVFSNGMRDPWSRGGVLRNISDSVVALVTKQGAHHVDLRSATEEDPDWLVELRRREVEILQKWIDQYYSDIKYASDSTVTRYVKIAKELQDKTVRDVVLRCRWMSKKESGKRRKEDHNQMKKSNKKGGSDPSKSSSHLVAQPSMPHPLPIPMLQMDNDDDIPYQEIGGATGKLLEQNTQFSNQISANLASFQIQDNINLLCQMRDNILTIMNETDDMPGIMSQMPPLPVKVNEELAKSILPRPPLKLQTS